VSTELETHREAGSLRRTLRRSVFVAIGLLYLVSVPWYRATGAPVAIVAGLPDWVAVAIACYIAVAVLNGVAWMLTEVPEPPPEDPSTPSDAV